MNFRKLTERQVRWAEFMSQFSFKLGHRPGRLAGRPDALSRCTQDVPGGPDDPRLKEREFQLISPEMLLKALAPIQVAPVAEELALVERRVPKGSEVFNDDDLAVLWDRASLEDKSFLDLYKAMWTGERMFPLHLKDIKAQLSECEIDPQGVLLFRNRV